MLVIMRIGENAPTREQKEESKEELRRLIRQETYLEEKDPMDTQVQGISVSVTIAKAKMP